MDSKKYDYIIKWINSINLKTWVYDSKIKDLIIGFTYNSQTTNYEIIYSKYLKRNREFRKLCQRFYNEYNEKFNNPSDLFILSDDDSFAPLELNYMYERDLCVNNSQGRLF